MKSLRVNRVENGKAGAARDVACDAVLMCGGWTPACTSSATPRAASPGTRRSRPSSRQEVRGRAHRRRRPRPLGIAAALTDGAAAGAQAARDAGREAAPQATPSPPTAPARRHAQGAADRPQPSKAKAFIDFQNDVTAKDIRLAVREGMRSIEHVKRYTTNGMATDQGKMSNVNGLMIAADALGKAPPQVGLTTFRRPTRRRPSAPSPATTRTRPSTSPADPDRPWAEAHGAAFEPVALWRRAWYFEGGRGHARRGRPRVPRHPRLARHLRRLDPRQDRGRRPGRRRPSWSGCTPTPGRSSASAAAATACCSARTASSATTASSAASPPTAPRHHHHRRRGASST